MRDLDRLALRQKFCHVQFYACALLEARVLLESTVALVTENVLYYCIDHKKET